MRFENQTRLDKIKRVSNILRVACRVLLALITLGFLAGTIALVVNKGGAVRYFSVWFLIDELTLRSRLIVISLNALTFGIIFKCFFHLHRLLGNYSRREIFTGESVCQIRQLGITCMLWGGLNFLWIFMPLAILTQPPKMLEGSLDLVFVGATIFIISWFMEMAVELREENELTV